MTPTVEQPIYLPGPDGPIFAIVTTPQEPIASTILCSGGWHGGSFRSNRMLMRMANRLAIAGHQTIRFDWHGSGESPGHIEKFDLLEPFTDDAVAVASSVPDADGRPASLVGFCFGARSALGAAPTVKNLSSIALVSYPFPAGLTRVKRAAQVSTKAALREAVRFSAIKGWFQPATRRVYVKFIKLRWKQLTRRIFPDRTESPTAEVSPRQESQAVLLDELITHMRELVRRNVRILMVFGEQDAMYERWLEAQHGELGDLVAASGNLVSVHVVAGDLYGFSSKESQETVVSLLSSWLTKRVAKGD